LARKSHPARPSARLWGAIRVWTILFLIFSAANVAAYGYRLWLLNQLASDTWMTEMSFLSDYLPGAEAELWVTGLANLLYVPTYVIAAILVLMWFLRSIRNAHALSNGVETSPAWVIWWFIIPLVSFWKPYGMASELWRSSKAPDNWRGLPDPVLLRWWWAFVLLGGFVFSASNILSRTAETAGQVAIADAALIAGQTLHMTAGVLFLRIGGPISKRQTELIGAGRVAPPPEQPGWAA
jgi:hypothetical protein